MKLLFDENLSYRLVRELAGLFPGSSHVCGVGLEHADDEAIWDFARQQGYTIISKDDDFHQRSFLYGAPPKVIWLRLGNCSTALIASVLSRHIEEINAFVANSQATFLVLSATH